MQCEARAASWRGARNAPCSQHTARGADVGASSPRHGACHLHVREARHSLPVTVMADRALAPHPTGHIDLPSRRYPSYCRLQQAGLRERSASKGNFSERRAARLGAELGRWPSGGSSRAPWGPWKSDSHSFWLELPGGLLKPHSHSAMRFRTASSSASMTRHFLAEGSVHLALEGHDLQGKADSVCARQGPQAWPGGRRPQRGSQEGRQLQLQTDGSCAPTECSEDRLSGTTNDVRRHQAPSMCRAPQDSFEHGSSESPSSPSVSQGGVCDQER